MLAGSDAKGWLATLANWGIAMSLLRLYALPGSMKDRSPACALVVGQAVGPGMDSPSSLPYGCVGERLYVPVESILSPPMGEEEIRRLLPGHVYVMHPSLGLVAFEESDAIEVRELIAPPPPCSRTWDRAVPGVSACRRLRSVTVESMPTSQEVLDEGRDDISYQRPDDISALPNDPAGNAIQRFTGKALLAALGLIKSAGNWLAANKQAPPRRNVTPGTARPASNAGANGGLSRWIERKFTAINERMIAARFKEIARLMQLLQSDPDLGLRYALPLAALAHRGRAAPDDTLAPHSTQFDLSMLSGGRAADLWDIPHEYRARLMWQYRQAADREIRLRRFRRAAYIFAVLIGDYHAAANALRQGKHFHEAAAIYRDQLNNMSQAAQCLEQAGLFLEAIPLYEQLEEYEKVGDLYATIGHAEESHDAYRKAVDEACAADKRLVAAGILERKLKSPDEAIELLAKSWPDGVQAMECFEAQISLLGRLGRHGHLKALIDPLRTQAPQRHLLGLVGSLARISGVYPDQATRHIMADTVRVMSSRALVGAAQSDVAAVANALTRLCPQDRLLRRDASRYASRNSMLRVAKPPSPTTAMRSRHKTVALLRVFELPQNVKWSKFEAAHGFLYAGGYGKSPVAGTSVPCIMVHNWRDESSVLRLRQTYAQEEPLIVAVDPMHEHRVLVTTLRGRRLTYREQAISGGTLGGGIPTWAPDNVAGMAFGNTGELWMLVMDGDELHLTCYSPRGQVRHSQSLGLVDPDEPVSLSMLARGEGTWIAANNRIICCQGRDHLGTEMPSTILSFSATMPNSLLRIAVTLDSGGRILLTGPDWPREVKFGEGLVAPIAAFTNDGNLIAVSKGAGRVYHMYKGELEHLADFDAPNNTPLAVLSTPSSNQFAIATNDSVYVYGV